MYSVDVVARRTDRLMVLAVIYHFKGVIDNNSGTVVDDVDPLCEVNEIGKDNVRLLADVGVDATNDTIYVKMPV